MKTGEVGVALAPTTPANTEPVTVEIVYALPSV
jgi:hypothetical protein